MIKVLFFAKLREALGQSELQWPLAAEASVEDVRAALVAEYPQWQEALCASNVLTALNQEVVNAKARVKPGDELAFYPPVTGG
ncbi:molybdopterin converting factor subunit 1 [Litorivivens sp.]|jgi:sulfur-carrier protein|uniref:molybdopterin converting factor subunit 1 n=1 Tax=Litorivivens sp. TaxID=2020868 RepID=UPI000C583E34|nr:molybdopterin converting factor subunit 1 [Spongiibacteraceae bacterium]